VRDNIARNGRATSLTLRLCNASGKHTWAICSNVDGCDDLHMLKVQLKDNSLQAGPWAHPATLQLQRVAYSFAT